MTIKAPSLNKPPEPLRHPRERLFGEILEREGYHTGNGTHVRLRKTWRTFLTNHLASAASMDFFTVPTLTGRVLFVVVLLSHHPAHRPRQYHGSSDGHVVRSTNGVPLCSEWPEFAGILDVWSSVSARTKRSSISTSLITTGRWRVPIHRAA
jgi:hypothetical protein